MKSVDIEDGNLVVGPVVLIPALLIALYTVIFGRIGENADDKKAQPTCQSDDHVGDGKGEDDSDIPGAGGDGGSGSQD